MAIFHHFLTFLATFLVVTTTFMDKTCAERTQTLVTCMVGGNDPFCPSPGTYMAQGGVQKMAILGVKTGVLTSSTLYWIAVRTMDMLFNELQRQ